MVNTTTIHSMAQRDTYDEIFMVLLDWYERLPLKQVSGSITHVFNRYVEEYLANDREAPPPMTGTWPIPNFNIGQSADVQFSIAKNGSIWTATLRIIY